MGKALALAAVLVLLAAPAAEAASKPPGGLRAGAKETVLRLHDLPPGYTIDSESGCDAFTASGDRALGALDRWIVENRPVGCEFRYERHFSVAGIEPTPPQVKGETIDTPSDEAAARGIAIFLRLVPRLTKWQPAGTVSLGPAGATARLFRFKEGHWATSVLLWRHGSLLAALEVGGLNPADIDSAALHYAQVQQQHLESPSPYTEAERDDTEVVLDDPSLTLPVYWLGRTFEPANGLGTEALETAAVIDDRGLPGVRLELRYGGVNLETWTRRGWKRFQRSFLGKLNRPPCSRTTAFEWERGHALISAGYRRRPIDPGQRRRAFDQGCPDYPPTRYWAVAHVGGVVVGVNQTTCRCLAPGSGPYSESLRGMKTLLRGLTLRAKPTY